MRDKLGLNCILAFVVLLCLVPVSTCLAVSSKVVRHTSSSDLLKGQAEKVVIGSRGTIQLGRAAEALIKDFKGFADVWSINSIVVSGGTIYFGTSPNGGIYKYSLNKLTKIYPLEADQNKTEINGVDKLSSNLALREPNEKVEDEEHLSNEHIFAMATDVAGRLLAGISGKKCRLCRFEADKMEVIFEPNEAKYIFAIAMDDGGNIYLGTGPEGKVYKLDSLGKKAQLVYESRDKNILSLAIGQDGTVYAGSDSRGLVYKIDPRTKKATVLYDSNEPEITALLFKGNSESDTGLYAAATSAKIVQTQAQFAASTLGKPSAGRPEEKTEKDTSSGENKGGLKLEIPNTKKPTSSKPSSSTPPISKGAKPGKASHIYRITKDGFVTDIFGEAAVFFCLADQDAGTPPGGKPKLLIGTGNDARLFSVDTASEQKTVIYEDEQASQITAIAVAGDDVYLGTANPAKLIKLASGFASEGTYTSDLIDASQPAKWGKLQLEADIPQGCKVQVASRSGNVKDVNDPTFSQWSQPVGVAEPVQLVCPLGRFCQYKLILQSRDGSKSPLIREIAVASTVPNLAPRVESVTVNRTAAASKKGFFKISYKTKDDNGDKLIYKIDFRKAGRTNWIELKDELETASFDWDGKTVEDGRYEVRITASDARSNTTSTTLTATRVSEPVVVDNTGPVVKDMEVTSTRKDNEQYRIFKFEVTDELSAIGKLEYTIDSNAKWISTVPDDLVYDTTNENFTIKIDEEKDLPKGDHVLTIKVSDAVGNTTYKTFEVNVD
ncbi:MAG: Ig-like domain-containing protein [Planctomycetota bacterium]|jgi:hypothetical protein